MFLVQEDLTKIGDGRNVQMQPVDLSIGRTPIHCDNPIGIQIDQVATSLVMSIEEAIAVAEAILRIAAAATAVRDQSAGKEVVH